MDNAYLSNSWKLFNSKSYEWWWHHFSGSDSQGRLYHFYLEFFIMNPHQNTPNPQFYPNIPCYVMIKGGMWPNKYNKGCQINSFYPIHDFHNLSHDHLDIRIANNIVKENYLQGEISNHNLPSRQNLFSDKGSIKFDLKIIKKNSFDAGYATKNIFLFANLFDMYWFVKGIDAKYCGYIIVNEKKYTINYQTSFGYQDKNWGRNFSDPWLWISSSCIHKDGKLLKNASMVCGGVHPSILNRGIGKSNNILLYIRISDSEIYEFNFTKYRNEKIRWQIKQTKNDLEWFIILDKNNLHITLSIVHKLRELINVHYENPYGKMIFKNLFNGGNGHGKMSINGKIYELSHCGCEFGST